MVSGNFFNMLTVDKVAMMALQQQLLAPEKEGEKDSIENRKSAMAVDASLVRQRIRSQTVTSLSSTKSSAAEKKPLMSNQLIKEEDVEEGAVCQFVFCIDMLTMALYGLRGGNALISAMCKLFVVCLLNFLSPFLFSLLCSFLMLFFSLIYFLTCLIPDLSNYFFPNSPIPFPGLRTYEAFKPGFSFLKFILCCSIFYCSCFFAFVLFVSVFQY